MPANPGSSAAMRLGCTCPKIDNAFGEGAVVDGRIDPNQFYLDPACPLHADRRKINESIGRGESDSDGDDGVSSGRGDDSRIAVAEKDIGLTLGEGDVVAELQAPPDRRDKVQGDREEEAR